MKQAIDTLRAVVADARDGLPEELFLFISSLTPMVNVDLLIRDNAGRTLLSWRDDAFYGPGWHVPGGIVRFKETAAARIAKVAEHELGARVSFDDEPLCIREIMHPTRAVRGHFLSMLYACALTSTADEARRYHQGQPAHGEWAWHARCPQQLIAVHEVYRPFIGGGEAGSAAHRNSTITQEANTHA